MFDKKNLLISCLLHKESYVHQGTLLSKGGKLFGSFSAKFKTRFCWRSHKCINIKIFQSENQKVSTKELSNWHTQNVHIDLQNLKNLKFWQKPLKGLWKAINWCSTTNDKETFFLYEEIIRK